MSKIAEQIKQLREQEKRLERETRKVEFLNHILDSAKDYQHKAFSDVKEDVVGMLAQFVKKSIEAIETGTELQLSLPTINIVAQSPVAPPQPQVAAPVQTQPKKPEDQISPNEKLNFALDNRHLAGKKVSVINDMNIDISGEVVGLDAPFVLVKTATGPVIKVPLMHVSLQ